jgi:hypothetical protein
VTKKKEYILKGTCIWCLKSKPEVTFNNKPHTISKQIGSTNIGFDICDSCNRYFGTVDKESCYEMSVELAFKEIINVIRHLLLTGMKSKLNSVYFDFFRSKRQFKIRKAFKYKYHFLSNFTRQFKRGVYEIFLQEYHRCTKNGLDNRFNKLRNFVRFDKGDIPLYFLVNNGVYFLESDIESPSFEFNENVLQEIDDYGFYMLIITGHVFFLEVTPRAEISREIYLKRESSKLIGSGFAYKGLKELKYITDIDFTLRELNGIKK